VYPTAPRRYKARAKRHGYDEIHLESGARQPEAIGLYEQTGYRRIPNYGPWAHNEETRCFGKRLEWEDLKA
jgi:ribosomal protein S18 acetylase RimI-like enzyme